MRGQFKNPYVPMKLLTKSKREIVIFLFEIISVTSLISNSPLWYRTNKTNYASSLLQYLNPVTCYKACRQNYWINMITSNLSVSGHTLITKQAIKVCCRLEKLQHERVLEGQLIFIFPNRGENLRLPVLPSGAIGHKKHTR